MDDTTPRSPQCSITEAQTQKELENVVLTMAEPEPCEPQPGPSHQDSSTISVDESPLDPELLLALGEFASDSPDYGDNIHNNLSQLWLPLLKKGILKETKDKIMSEYLIPNNCRLLQSPKLNAEIFAAVPDMVRNRDKILAGSQQQLGLAITAINRGMHLLLKGDDKIQAMKHLSNGCRLLCDSHYSATRNRIKLLTPSLDKSILHVIQECDRDETLFGSSLGDKLKAAKAIEKQGLQLKNKTSRSQKAPPSTSGRPNNFQGNWSAPPRFSANRGGRGAYRRPTMSTAPAARRGFTAAQPRAVNHSDKPRAPTHH